jgi:ABC-2 type transport system permease protein
MSFIQAAYVIGRRDFTATVMSRTFLFFLGGPLLIIGISVLFGNLSGKMARQDVRATIAVIASQADFAPIGAAHERVAKVFREGTLPDLSRVEPDYDPGLQTEQLLAAQDQKVVAVLTGGVARPTLTGSVREDGSVRKQMGLILDEARQNQALAAGGRPFAPTDIRIVRVQESAGETASLRAMTARGTQLLLFMLTVLLAGMLLSNLLEEKSNKIIEVLAAAVPIDAVFTGKLFSMLAVSAVGIAVWGVGAIAAILLWSEGAIQLTAPAVGWPLFVLLTLIYYSAAYLLLGAVFLAIGSQANSVREVQTLSMPVTIAQMLIFLFASFAIGQPNSLIGLSAVAFPFSSPLAMVARAAQLPELWPHLVALVWQAFWVWLVISLGATLFRRNVLKSGGGSMAAIRPKRA